MKSLINAELLTSLSTGVVRDTEITGLMCRAYPSGKLGLYLDYRLRAGPRKGKRTVHHLISYTPAVLKNQTPKAMAKTVRLLRAQATLARAMVDDGQDPAQERREARLMESMLADERKAKRAEKALQDALREESQANTINNLSDGAYSREIRGRKSSASTLRMLVSAWAPIADMPIRDITRVHIESVLDNLVVSDASKDRYLTTIKAMFTWAVKTKRLDVNPCTGIEKLSGSFDYSARPKSLSPDEVSRLFAVTDGEFGLLVKLAVYTGMRRGELLQLQWENIEGNVVTIPKAYTKSNKTREVTLPVAALEALGEHGVGSVFTLSVNQVKRLWAKARAAAGIEGGFHGLRHTYGFSLSNAGVPIQLISQLMGHSTIDMTIRYTRKGAADLTEVDVLSSLFK